MSWFRIGYSWGHFRIGHPIGWVCIKLVLAWYGQNQYESIPSVQIGHLNHLIIFSLSFTVWCLTSSVGFRVLELVPGCVQLFWAWSELNRRRFQGELPWIQPDFDLVLSLFCADFSKFWSKFSMILGRSKRLETVWDWFAPA